MAELGHVDAIVFTAGIGENQSSHRENVCKKLGYIARNALPQYRNFNPDNHVCPFAGHVQVTRQGYLWADILVALPKDRVFVLRELSNYVDSKQIHV